MRAGAACLPWERPTRGRARVKTPTENQRAISTLARSTSETSRASARWSPSSCAPSGPLQGPYEKGSAARAAALATDAAEATARVAVTAAAAVVTLRGAGSSAATSCEASVAGVAAARWWRLGWGEGGGRRGQGGSGSGRNHLQQNTQTVFDLS